MPFQSMANAVTNTPASSSEYNRVVNNVNYHEGRINGALNDILALQDGGELSRTTNAGPFTTTEVVLDTITVTLTSGRLYRILWDGAFFSTVADGFVRARIRENNLTGNTLQLGQVPTTAASNQAFSLRMEGWFTATATGLKSFVATGQRIAGTGNITSQAGFGTTTYFYVESRRAPL